MLLSSSSRFDALAPIIFSNGLLLLLFYASSTGIYEKGKRFRQGRGKAFLMRFWDWSAELLTFRHLWMYQDQEERRRERRRKGRGSCCKLKVIIHGVIFPPSQLHIFFYLSAEGRGDNRTEKVPNGIPIFPGSDFHFGRKRRKSRKNPILRLLLFFSS